jgi:Tfp pilus assembly protein PilV
MKLNLRRRPCVPAQHQITRRRSGLSVIEIVVALMLFGTVTVSMAGLSLVVARRAEGNDVFTKRTALLQQQMNWLQATPYDSLGYKDGKVVVTDGPFPHTRYVSVSPMGNRTLVSIEVVPSKAPESGENIQFYRARPTKSPLCKGC